MKTEHAIALAGSPSALASLFEITTSAVSQWGVDIPHSRYWELRVKKPEWFNPDGSAKAPEEVHGTVTSNT
jgi:hypothetical protein